MSNYKSLALVGIGGAIAFAAPLLTGKVLKPDSTPWVGITVKLQSTLDSAITDATGAFALGTASSAVSSSQSLSSSLSSSDQSSSSLVSSASSSSALSSTVVSSSQNLSSSLSSAQSSSALSSSSQLSSSQSSSSNNLVPILKNRDWSAQIQMDQLNLSLESPQVLKVEALGLQGQVQNILATGLYQGDFSVALPASSTVQWLRVSSAQQVQIFRVIRNQWMQTAQIRAPQPPAMALGLAQADSLILLDHGTRMFAVGVSAGIASVPDIYAVKRNYTGQVQGISPQSLKLELSNSNNNASSYDLSLISGSYSLSTWGPWISGLTWTAKVSAYDVLNQLMAQTAAVNFSDSSASVSFATLSSAAVSSANQSSAVLSSSSAQSSSAALSSVANSSSSQVSCVAWSANLYTWNGTTYSGPTCISNGGSNYSCVSGKETSCNNYSPANNSWNQWQAYSGGASSSTRSSSSTLSSVAVSSSTVISSSSIAVSSVALSSSAAGCTATPTGKYFNFTNGSTTLAGYVADNSSIAAQDYLVPVGVDCNQAQQVDYVQGWNVYLKAAWAGTNATNVQAAKVTGTITPGSSTAQSSSASSSSATSSSSSSSTQASTLGGWFTKAMFDALFPKRNLANCTADGNSIYTYENFMQAASRWPAFGTTGDDNTRKRELAGVFAHYVQETGSNVTDPTSGLCWTKERCAVAGTCLNNYNTDFSGNYPPVTGQYYYGRGPKQLSWPGNYGWMSQEVYGDKNRLLNNPDLVATDGVVAFESSMWFWMQRSESWTSDKATLHEVMTAGATYKGYRGFGATTQMVNGALECFAGNTAMTARANNYIHFQQALGIPDAQIDRTNIYCPN